MDIMGSVEYYFGYRGQIWDIMVGILIYYTTKEVFRNRKVSGYL